MHCRLSRKRNLFLRNLSVWVDERKEEMTQMSKLNPGGDHQQCTDHETSDHL